MSTRSRQALDPSIRRLVRAINAFPGAETIGSCGGHPNPVDGQWPEGSWYVNIVFDRSEAGHFALEFLAWAINNDYRRGGYRVMLYPYAPPPYLNQPGQVLRYHLEGYDTSADELAAFLNKVRRKGFISPEKAVRL